MTPLEKARQYEREHQSSPESQPAFHVSPPVGWMNDPNGFSRFGGTNHLFFQYHPYSLEWGPMHWGHVVSDDLVVWKRRPAALAPDQPWDKDGCFSGSAVEIPEGHLLVYTAVRKDEQGERQSQAFALGDGTNYTKLEQPLITGEQLPEGFSRQDFRDPKIWLAADGWHLAAGSRTEENTGQIVHFTSPDRRHWTYAGLLARAENGFGTMWECPDVFELDGKDLLICSPQNIASTSLKFHNGHNAVWLTRGKGEAMFASENPEPLDYGLDFYAPQTMELPDGRRVLIGWMASWQAPVKAPGQVWLSQMTLPRELSFRNGRLIQKPIRELDNWVKTRLETTLDIEAPLEAEGVAGRYGRLQLDFEKPLTTAFAIDFAVDAARRTTFLVDPFRDVLVMDRTFSGMDQDYQSIRQIPMPEGGVQKIDAVLDLHSIEIFINEGEMVLSTSIPTPYDCEGIRFQAADKVRAELCFEVYDTEAMRKEAA